jgi:membrane associated rhomboid family serine protease
MRHFILFLAILCGVASFLFFAVAQEAASGAYWAVETCAAARVFCERPLSFLLAAGALVALWLLLNVTSSFVD